MTRRATLDIQIPGVWDKNIPSFMETLIPQKKYDYFTALRHNISNPKILGVIFHRICGDYIVSTPSLFTEKFKLLKKWLFLSDRTDKLPTGAYLAMWKAWKLYQDAGEGKILDCQSHYRASLEELYPENQYMFVSSKVVTEPIYYLYKPQKPEDMEIDDDEEEQQPEFDEYGNPMIPPPCLVADSYIQTSKMFEYIYRHYLSVPCDYCGHNLELGTISLSVTCNHFVHKTCCENYQCLKCDSEKWRTTFTAWEEHTVSENEDNTL
jgi:hypothetical protein